MRSSFRCPDRRPTAVSSWNTPSFNNKCAFHSKPFTHFSNNNIDNKPSERRDTLTTESFPPELLDKPAKFFISIGLNPFVLQQQIYHLQQKVVDQAEQLVKRAEEVIETKNEVLETKNEVVATQKEVTKKADEVTKKADEVTKKADEVARKAEEISVKVKRIGELEKELTEIHGQLDRERGRSNLRGVLESIVEEINKKTGKNFSNTSAIKLLFDEKDPVVGQPFMNYLRRNIQSNQSLVESDVVKEGKNIYSTLSGFQHGAIPEVEIYEAVFNRNQQFVLGCILRYFTRHFTFVNAAGHTTQFPYSISS